MNAYENLTESEIKNLSESAQNCFHLIHSFGKKEQLTNLVNIWMLEDSIQMPKVTFGPFQIYFYKTFFTTQATKWAATKI